MSRGPDDECGITVAIDTIIARSGARALVVRSLIAYSDGVRLDLSIHSRTPVGDGWDEALYGSTDEGLLLAYGFQEPALSSLGPVIPPESTSDVQRELLFAGGGDGDTGRFDIDLWTTPRRTVPFQIAAVWPRQGIKVVQRNFTMPSEAECRDRIVNLWSN